MSQVQTQRSSSSKPDKQEPEVAAAQRTDDQQELLDYSEDLMDEIDEALQGLEQDLALTYRQKGGE